MKKAKVLSISSLLLLLINIGLLIFIFFGNKQRPAGDKNRNIIIKELNFDEKQIAQYDSLIMEHREKINQVNDRINIQRQKLYVLLTTETNPKDSILATIANEQVKIEAINFEHFLGIKQICMPSQISHYNNLTKKLSALFDKNKKRNEGK
jgi:hypothetical protein